MSPDIKRQYGESVATAARRIREHVPGDLVDRFSDTCSMSADDLHPIARAPPGTVSAVDGSNAMVLESGSMAFAAVRAARTTFLANERDGRAVTPLMLVTIGPGHRNEDFDRLFSECFGAPPRRGLDNADPERASAILRDTLEYWVAQETARALPSGSLLLLDGALRFSNQNHEPVLAEIIRTAQAGGLYLAAVAKRTRATWGGGHPLLPALSGLAARARIAGPWWTRIDEHILDHTEYRQGRHGDIYVASLHPQAKRPLKMELPKGTGHDRAAETMQALAACAGDGRIPGYPYPLLDAHRTVAISDALVLQVRQDLMAGLARLGIGNRQFDDLFGDLHGDFERY